MIAFGLASIGVRYPIEKYPTQKTTLNHWTTIHSYTVELQ